MRTWSWVPAIVGLLFATPWVAAADEIDHFTVTSGLFTLTTPSVTEVITLSGSMVQTVQIGASGEASDSNSNGLDDVSAEVTSLSLSGTSSLGLVQVSVASASPGSIEEAINNTPGILDMAPFTASGSGTMEFDIFLAMQIGGGPILTSEGSTHVSAHVVHKPPQNVDDLWASMSTVDFAELGRPVGVSLGACTPEPGLVCPAVPEPGTLVLTGGGMAALGLRERRRRRE